MSKQLKTMKPDKALTEQESLDIIKTMLAKTQTGIRDNGFMFLLWGWLVFAAAVIHYVPMMFMNSTIGGLAWPVLMTIGGITSAIYSIKQSKKQEVKTYAHQMLNYTTIAMGVGIAFTLTLGGLFTTWNITYGFLMLVYGTWLFMAGGILEFKPLQAGGIVNWILGAVTFFVPEPHELPMIALAVLLGYIIPGHLMKARFDKESK